MRRLRQTQGAFQEILRCLPAQSQSVRNTPSQGNNGKVNVEVVAVTELYSGKRVAVLGGNGMLGSYVVDLLAASGAIVTVVDLAECPYRETPKDAVEAILDCSVPHSWRHEEFDIVINCAAKVTGITYNERHHADMALANAGLATAPLQACIEAKVSRYVYVSTACVYPADADVPTEEFWGWRGWPEPTNYGYGLAKRFGEQLCMVAKDEHPWFNPLVLRPSNLYSQREHFDDENAHVIPRTIRRVLSGENPIVMRGTGMAMRSFLHARDAAYGLLLAAATNYSGILNLPAGANHECSIAALVKHICAAAKLFPIVQFSNEGADGYQRRLSSRTLLQQTLAADGLAWQPETSLADGLKETVEACKRWMNEH